MIKKGSAKKKVVQQQEEKKECEGGEMSLSEDDIEVTQIGNKRVIGGEIEEEGMSESKRRRLE